MADDPTTARPPEEFTVEVAGGPDVTAAADAARAGVADALGRVQEAVSGAIGDMIGGVANAASAAMDAGGAPAAPADVDALLAEADAMAEEVQATLDEHHEAARDAIDNIE